MIRVISTISLLHFCTALQLISDRLHFAGKELSRNRLGHLESAEYSEEGGIIKTVYSSQKPFREDYERQTSVIQNHITQFEVNKERISKGTIYRCDNRGGSINPDDAMYFMPIQAGVLSHKNPQFTFTDGMCFKNIKFSYSHTGTSD